MTDWVNSSISSWKADLECEGECLLCLLDTLLSLHCLPVWIEQAFQNHPQHQGSEIWISACTAQLLFAQLSWIPHLGNARLGEGSEGRLQGRPGVPPLLCPPGEHRDLLWRLLQSARGPSGGTMAHKLLAVTMIDEIPVSWLKIRDWAS